MIVVFGNKSRLMLHIANPALECVFLLVPCVLPSVCAPSFCMGYCDAVSLCVKLCDCGWLSAAWQWSFATEDWLLCWMIAVHKHTECSPARTHTPLTACLALPSPYGSFACECRMSNCLSSFRLRTKWAHPPQPQPVSPAMWVSQSAASIYWF